MPRREIDRLPSVGCAASRRGRPQPRSRPSNLSEEDEQVHEDCATSESTSASPPRRPPPSTSTATNSARVLGAQPAGRGVAADRQEVDMDALWDVVADVLARAHRAGSRRGAGRCRRSARPATATGSTSSTRSCARCARRSPRPTAGREDIVAGARLRRRWSGCAPLTGSMPWAGATRRAAALAARQRAGDARDGTLGADLQGLAHRVPDRSGRAPTTPTPPAAAW